MKKTLFALLLLVPHMTAMLAQDGVTFELIRGIENGTVKSKIESETTKLLTMLNERQSDNKDDLSFKGISITEEAKQTILLLWKFQHMRVWQDVEGEEPYIAETCLRFGRKGYQVRNIPMRLYPVENNGEDDDYTEICINYDLSGNIVDFNITMAKQQYQDILKSAINVEDEYNRMVIAHLMEQLRTAYNQKNLQFFKDIFSEDAIIITGVRKFRLEKTEARIKDQAKYEYNVSTKAQYVESLSRVFKKNNVINVVFGNDAKYKRDGSARYYMVDVTQYWNSSTYSDEGRLFLLWDFNDPDNPQILVRAWQHTDDDKHFSFKDFKLP